MFPVFFFSSDELKRLLASYTKENGAEASDIAFSTYTMSWGSNPNRETVKKSVVDVGTDYIFLVATQAALYLHATHAKLEKALAICILLSPILFCCFVIYLYCLSHVWIVTLIFLFLYSLRTGHTYSYLFSEPNRLGGIAKPYPPWMGADHADDLQYVFGKPFSTPLGYWPRHRDVSGYMIAYWTNFAKTG